ncbi:MAG: DUF1573 domain-containing protein [Gemmataceae bacterium]|nr:DUF1573 domain-containing protein [Gemmataceae bacterium]
MSYQSSCPARSAPESKPGSDGPSLCRLCLIALILGLICGTGYCIVYRLQSLDAQTGSLVVDAEHLNFGEVFQQKQFRWKLPIQNRSDKELEISHFSASCSCVEITPPSLIVAPNQTAVVVLTLDLTELANPSDTVPRVFKEMIIPRVKANDGRGVFHEGWSLQGRVEPGLLARPRTVDFGREILKTNPQRRSEVVSVIAQPGVVELGLEPNYLFSAFLRQSTKLPDGSEQYEVRITPSKDLRTGYFKSQILVRASHKDSGSAVDLSVPVQGYVREDVDALPSAVVFGARALGDIGEEALSLSSKSGQSFEVIGIHTEGAGINCAPSETTSPKGRIFRVRQRFSQLGPTNNCVRFTIQGHNQIDVMTVEVSVAYHGYDGPAHDSRMAAGKGATKVGEVP